MSVELAQLRCVTRRPNGNRCGADVVSGTRRCRRHRQVPAERIRCQYRWSDGVRCEGRVKNAGRGDETCVPHQQPCRGWDGTPCGRRRARLDDGLCRSCAALERRCLLELDEDGRLCEAKVSDPADRCGNHEPSKWPDDEHRCQRRYPSGERCHRARNRGAEVCIRHYRVCECGQQTGRAEGLCGRCSPRCVECQRPPTPGADRCYAHSRVSCSEIAAHSNELCGSPAVENGRCKHHRDLPADEDRCVVFHTGYGRRCPNRRKPGNPDEVCHRHRNSWELIGRDPADSGFGTGGCVIRRGPGDGHPCANPALEDGLCQIHLDIVGDDDRCQHRYSDGSRCPAQHLAATGRGSGLVCVDHRVACTVCQVQTADVARGLCRDHRPRCTARSGKSGQLCRHGAQANSNFCGRHRALAGRDDGCRFVYDDGSACLNACLESGSRCRLHRVACSVCGELTQQGDGLCRAHRPLCAETKVNGERCTQPAYELHAGLCSPHFQRKHGGRCELLTMRGTPCAWPASVHTDDGHICAKHAGDLEQLQLRCLYVFGTGQRCPGARSPLGSGTVGVRELPERQHHAFCTAHWTSSGLDCQSVTVAGEACRSPAMLDADGKPTETCVLHFPVPAEQRCVFEFVTGGRCPAQRHQGRLYCAAHQDQQPICVATSQLTGDRCVWSTVGDLVYCGTHAPPADPERQCRAGTGDDRCPFHRLPGRLYCAEHVDEQPTCRARTRRDTACEYLALDDTGTCGIHQVSIDDATRCHHTDDDGLPCVWRRMPRRRFCSEHGHHQPRCAAVPRGFRCRRLAVEPHTTCDRHHGWTPGQLDYDQEALMRFFITPRADTLMRLQAGRARMLLAELDAGSAASASGVSHPNRSVTACSNDEVGVSMSDPVPDPLAGLPDAVREIAEKDPHDLTGARRRYQAMLAEGRDPEEAARAVKLIAKGRATSTLRSYTSKLKPWFEWCEENLVSPCPAEPTDVLLFLGWLAERGRTYDGEPLQTSTFRGFQTTISRLHDAMNHPDPFKLDPDLRMALDGYARTYGRVQRQAHAIRAPELVRLVQAAHGVKIVGDQQLRDEAILAIVADPEVGLSQVEAAALTWRDVVRWPEEGADEPVVLLAGRGKKTEREVEIPNRSAGISPADLSGEEVPLVARLCGVAALRSLHARKVSSSSRATGPVFPKPTGAAMGNTGIKKVLTTLCAAAGIDYAPTLSFDDRALALLALDEPEFIGLRDAAILCVSWWASLRRSEVAELTVGSIGGDSRGRGLIVLVGRSKNDQEGQGRFVAVPHARVNGRTLPIDLQTVLHRYLDAYARRLGRPLEPGDPLFINAHHKTVKLEAVKTDAVGKVIARYAEKAGLEAEIGEYLTHHGLRAGYATEALSGGMPAEAVARRQGRASTESLAGYFRLADPFEDSLTFLIDVDDLADAGSGFSSVEDLLMQTNLDEDL